MTQSPRRAAARGGFTLVEVLVAIVVLAVGVLGLTSTAAFVSRQISSGARWTIAANVAESRFEWLRSRPCAVLHDSSTTTRGIGEAWTILAGNNSTVRATVAVTRYDHGLAKPAEVFTTAISC